MGGCSNPECKGWPGMFVTATAHREETPPAKYDFISKCWFLYHPTAFKASRSEIRFCPYCGSPLTPSKEAEDE